MVSFFIYRKNKLLAMKNLKFLTYLFVFFIISCSPEDDTLNIFEEQSSIIVEGNTFTFNKNALNQDWLSGLTIDFQKGNTIDVGYNNENALLKFLYEELEDSSLFGKELEVQADGILITIESDYTIIKPIPKNSTLTGRPRPCPEGYSNLGVCYSEQCVRNAIGNYIQENSEALLNGQVISISLVNHLGGKRVCGKVAELTEE